MDLLKYHEDLFREVEESKKYGGHLIDITNATNWFYQENDQEIYDTDKDFPVLSPPWPFAYIEYKSPRYFHSDVVGTVPIPRYMNSIRYACLFTGLSIKEDYRQSALEEDILKQWTQLSLSLVGTKIQYQSSEIEAEREKAIWKAIEKDVVPFWLISFQLLMGNKRVCIPSGNFRLYLDKYGSPIPGTSIKLGDMRVKEDPTPLLFPFLFGINLLHCTTQIELRDRYDTFQLAQGRGRYQELKYKTLIVKPFEEKIKSEGNIGNSVKRALHFVRGNFANYGADNPLFGKHVGTFWRPAHTRGNKEYGIIEKDYKVVVD